VGSGAHPASCKTENGCCFPMCDAAEWQYWPLISVYFRGEEVCSYTFIAPYVYMVWCVFNEFTSFYDSRSFTIVGFEILTVVVMKSTVFWDITPCIRLTFNGLHGVISQKIILFIYYCVYKSPPVVAPKPTLSYSSSLISTQVLFLFGSWGYWHCGHSWPIVPASGDSGDSENDCGEADGM
jgi:hypothetical protein